MTAIEDQDSLQAEGVDPLSYQAYKAFSSALRRYGQLMHKDFSAEGVHFGQAACLRALVGNDGISQSELADKMHVSRPTVTAMLQAVERSGAIERRPDEKDQRLTRVYLTPAGGMLERRLRSVLAAHIMRTFGSLPEDDRRELARLLGLLGESAASEREGTAAR